MITDFIFIIRNLLCSVKMPEFQKFEFDELVIESCRSEYLEEVFHLYKDLHNGKDLSRRNKLLLRLAGNKFCYVVRSGSEIVGIGLYYFNKKDVRENTIHEGYTGLKKEYRGKGVGTIARKNALYHFSQVKSIMGVSSRISLDNEASYRGNVKLGFEVVEKYFDTGLKKERAYLICDLKKYKQTLKEHKARVRE